jgi:hypothetical protein
MCGLRSTVYLSILVGNGIGPLTRALVLRACSTISLADASKDRWSYASILIRILSLSAAIFMIFFLLFSFFCLLVFQYSIVDSQSLRLHSGLMVSKAEPSIILLLAGKAFQP